LNSEKKKLKISYHKTDFEIIITGTTDTKIYE